MQRDNAVIATQMRSGKWDLYALGQ